MDPPLSFACLVAPPSPKVWMGQREELSDGVMAVSVSTGQMVFPRVSELMAPQPGQSSPKWSTLSTGEHKSRMAPGRRHSENSCSLAALNERPVPAGLPRTCCHMPVCRWQLRWPVGGVGTQLGASPGLALNPEPRTAHWLWGLGQSLVLPKARFLHL